MANSPITAQNIRLRRADTNDISALNQLIRACHPSSTEHLDTLHQLITSGYVFCVDDPATKEPVACVGVVFCDGNAHIYPWVVLPHLQGEGIGRTMLSAIRTFATRHAKSRGIHALTLSLTGSTHPSGFLPCHAPDEQGLMLFKSPL